jgi:hypothetical protein
MLILRSRNSEIDGRRLRHLQCCLRFDYGDLVAHARVIGSAHYFECFLVGLHRVIENLLLCVLAANLKEVFSKAGLFTQPFILKIGRG